MAIPCTMPEREYDSFVDVDGKTARRVTQTSFGVFAPPPAADAITTQYPDNLTEIYEYREGGIAGTILNTVTVVYQSKKKELITSVVIV